MNAPDRIRLLGCPIDRVTAAQAVEHVLGSLRKGRGGWVVTPNLDHLRRLVTDPAFASLCADADLRLPDGMPLVWASRLQRTPLPERVAGSDLIWTLTAAAACEGRSVYFLGGSPGSADKAAAILAARSPGLRVAGTACPEFGFDLDADKRREIVDAVAAAAPDIVYVGLGSPKQERLIEELRRRLPGAWCLGLGISFSFVAGDVKRAPRWVRRIGMEWLHRLAQEPRRLVRRYLVEGLPFALRLLLVSGVSGLAGRAATPAPAVHPSPGGR